MPIRPEANAMVEFLNELITIDPTAVNALVNARVECNAQLAYHPTVQAGVKDDKYQVGLLGILNGFFGAFDFGPRVGWGAIQAIVELDGTISGFKLDDGV